MRISSNLPSIIAIPLLLVIIAGSIILFSVFFAILLIPMAIIGYKFWRAIKLARKANDANVIEAEYTLVGKRIDDL
jgi:membrane protein implicated in regulation of membrane protease activity